MPRNISGQQKREFLEKFHQVMTPDGDMKACGRYACTDLILLARQIDPTYTYGDTLTGRINVRQILALRRAL